MLIECKSCKKMHPKDPVCHNMICMQCNQLNMVAWKIERILHDIDNGQDTASFNVRSKLSKILTSISHYK